MTAHVQFAPAKSGIGRSVLAVAAGLALNVIAATAIDEVLHLLEIYPPWGQPMPDASDNALALFYRLAIGIASGYLVARLAPRAPITHALILAGIGTVFAAGGIVAALNMPLGPVWYPVALAISVIPTVYIGARLASRRGSPCAHA